MQVLGVNRQLKKKVLQALGCGRVVGERFLINAKSFVDSRAFENVADRIRNCLAEETRKFSRSFFRTKKAVGGHVAVEVYAKKVPQLRLRKLAMLDGYAR